MKLSDFNILYLNLSRRPERLTNIQNIIKKIKSPLQVRINAIDGQKFNETDLVKYKFHTHPLSKYISHKLGKLGCYLTHLKALKYAVTHGLSNVLILEDDIEIYGDLNIDLNIPLHSDIIYLGGLVDNISPLNQQFIKIQTPCRVYCTLSYAIIGNDTINRIYRKVLASRPEAIDLLYIHNIQTQNNSYILSTPCFISNFFFISDVTNIETKRPTYNKIKKYIINN
jgi:hypothetical protein